MENGKSRNHMIVETRKQADIRPTLYTKTYDQIHEI